MSKPENVSDQPAEREPDNVTPECTEDCCNWRTIPWPDALNPAPGRGPGVSGREPPRWHLRSVGAV
jgi:hypothetical protein